MGIKEITIHNGWFRAAGNVYKWTPDFHVFGIGIDVKLLKGEKIIVKVDGVRYLLDLNKADEFYMRYNSFKFIKNTKIIVFSKSILEPIDKPNNVMKFEKEETNQQMTLF